MTQPVQLWDLNAGDENITSDDYNELRGMHNMFIHINILFRKLMFSEEGA
jgi:hypothetical protein